jgi:lactoylglutathione lyase
MATPVNTYMGCAGIGVSDLERSADFYTRVLGMRELMKLNLGYMDEIIVGYGRQGAAVALMHWTDGSNPSYADLPVKLVFYVPDPPAVAAAIRAEGLPILREPTPVPELGDAVVGLAKDPDGYVIELLESPPPRA